MHPVTNIKINPHTQSVFCRSIEAVSVLHTFDKDGVIDDFRGTAKNDECYICKDQVTSVRSSLLILYLPCADVHAMYYTFNMIAASEYSIIL